jgi:hypothetical protein
MPITPFLAAYYLLTLAAVVAAWLKGGHPERLGAAATVIAFAVSFLTHALRVGDFYAGDAVIDLLLTAFFIWMAVTRDRWWPLFMAASMGLTMVVYISALVVPEIGPYAVISARIGLGILGALTLLAGTGERWLAGEPATSAAAVWRRRGT